MMGSLQLLTKASELTIGKQKEIAFIFLEKCKLSIFMYKSCQIKEKLYLNVRILSKDIKTVIVTRGNGIRLDLLKKGTHSVPRVCSRSRAPI